MTIDGNPNFEGNPNLPARNVSSKVQNQIWLSDMTNLWSHFGWSYLARIIELQNREVFGMAVKSNTDPSLIINALKIEVLTKNLLLVWFFILIAEKVLQPGISFTSGIFNR